MKVSSFEVVVLISFYVSDRYNNTDLTLLQKMRNTRRVESSKFILPAIICINLWTKAIRMFLPRHISDGSQTHGSWMHFGINNISGSTT